VGQQSHLATMGVQYPGIGTPPSGSKLSASAYISRAHAAALAARSSQKRGSHAKIAGPRSSADQLHLEGGTLQQEGAPPSTSSLGEDSGSVGSSTERGKSSGDGSGTSLGIAGTGAGLGGGKHHQQQAAGGGGGGGRAGSNGSAPGSKGHRRLRSTGSQVGVEVETHPAIVAGNAAVAGVGGGSPPSKAVTPSSSGHGLLVSQQLTTPGGPRGTGVGDNGDAGSTGSGGDSGGKVGGKEWRASALSSVQQLVMRGHRRNASNGGFVDKT
jgi:hypothetical protein